MWINLVIFTTKFEAYFSFQTKFLVNNNWSNTSKEALFVYLFILLCSLQKKKKNYRYHMERKIFQHLLDLKRLQIRSGQANEHMLVKRAIDTYHNSVAATIGAGRYTRKDYTYRGFEQFLYQSLRTLQKSPGSSQLTGLPETSDNPLLCTQSTHRCLHATHAYTGIPCAAYREYNFIFIN